MLRLARLCAHLRPHPLPVVPAVPAVAAGVVVLAVVASSGVLVDGGPAAASDRSPATHRVALPAPLDQIVHPTVPTPSLMSPVLPPAAAAAPAPIAPPPAAVTSGASASTLAANGIPTAALRAYKRAAAEADKRTPHCRIVWPLVAAIGRVESDHGRFADNVLHADGVSTPGIVGIPLNGNGTEVVRDTDHGRLDGDTTYDRAIGPMQFIPSTWAHWQVDADHDGKADVNDIDDAAAATAAYLCANGRDLGTYAGQRSAVLSYNHSTAYLKTVLGLETVYAHGVITVPTAPGHGHAAPKPVAPPKTTAPAKSGASATPPASRPTKPSTRPTTTAPTTPGRPTKSKPPTGAPTTSPTCPSSSPTASPTASPSPSPTSTACGGGTSTSPAKPAPSASPTE